MPRAVCAFREESGEVRADAHRCFENIYAADALMSFLFTRALRYWEALQRDAVADD